jgi:peptidyl-prolyl cis-trans isomerase A (cyclophilin A)
MKLTLVCLSLLFSGAAFASPVVVVETNKGNIEIELNEEKAPVTVGNFLSYVDSGFYNETLIHRVVKGFVIQGGGLTKEMIEKPTNPPIINEAKNGLSNLRGTIGMARTSVVDSATSEFFINTKDNTRLDYRDDQHYGYAVFGKVISGMDVVDVIENMAVHTVGEYDDVPVEQVVTLSIKRKPVR